LCVCEFIYLFPSFPSFPSVSRHTQIKPEGGVASWNAQMAEEAEGEREQKKHGSPTGASVAGRRHRTIRVGDRVEGIYADGKKVNMRCTYDNVVKHIKHDNSKAGSITLQLRHRARQQESTPRAPPSRFGMGSLGGLLGTLGGAGSPSGAAHERSYGVVESGEVRGGYQVVSSYRSLNWRFQLGKQEDAGEGRGCGAVGAGVRVAHGTQFEDDFLALAHTLRH